MIEQGATTVWELWNGDTADPAMNSGNHVMLVGDLTIWLYQNLAGIKSDDGFRTLDMAPLPIGDLTFVNAEYDSVRGMIKSHWRKENGQFVWDVTIPVGSKAFLTVPTNDRDSVHVNGAKPDFDANGKIVVGFGTYCVSAKW
jgi:alpha-L-rhamnosidase